MVIHTPRLCGEPIFVGGSSSAADDAAEKKRKELNVIECRPVVRDELYLQYINAGKVDQTGHGDRELPAASQMQDGQPLQEGAGNVGQTPQQDQPVSQEADSPSRYESASTQAPLKDDTVSQDKSQQGQDTTSGPAESPDTSEVEEFILGSYVLAYDRNSGEMTVNPDPEDVIKDEVNSGKTQVDGQKDDISQKEAEAMQALLLEFRRSLEDMMRNVGGVLQGARDEAVDVYDTIKKVQDAYEAAATGGASASSVKDGEGPVAGGESEGGKEVHQSVKQHNKGDEQQARFTRTGAHNHREIVEQYLKGQIGGLIPNKKGKAHRKGGATAPQLHRHREPVQQKIGTPQFRNMKRAFEQKWDDDNENEGSNSLSNEGKSGTEDKVKNVAVAAGAEARGHDEL